MEGENAGGLEAWNRAPTDREACLFRLNICVTFVFETQKVLPLQMWPLHMGVWSGGGGAQ